MPGTRRGSASSVAGLKYGVGSRLRNRASIERMTVNDRAWRPVGQMLAARRQAAGCVTPKGPRLSGGRLGIPGVDISRPLET